VVVVDIDGPESALFTAANTIGSLILAVYTKPPTYMPNRLRMWQSLLLHLQPEHLYMQTLHCGSDSTATNSVSTSPSATYDEKYWGISVDGVIEKQQPHQDLFVSWAIAVASLPL